MCCHTKIVHNRRTVFFLLFFVTTLANMPFF